MSAAQLDDVFERLEAGAAPALQRPCTLAQRRFWVLDRLDPGNPALNVAVRWRLEGRVSPSSIEQAFRLILARQEILRCCFRNIDGEPVQLIAAHVPFRIPVIDLSGLAAADAQAEAERIAQLEARASFDLETAPLIRVTLLHLGGAVTMILLTVHHAISDGWSIGVLAREMGAISAAIEEGRAPELPELRVSYGDFATWQSEWLGGPDFRVDEAFWTRTLRGVAVLTGKDRDRA